MGSTTGAGGVALNEKGSGFVASCSVLLVEAWSKENTLLPLIPPKEGLAASVVDECIFAIFGVPSLPTKVAVGSVLEEVCNPKVKGDGEDCGGAACPKALVALAFAGFPSSIGTSSGKLGWIEDDIFPPDEELDAGSSKLTSLFEAGKGKGCFGSTVSVGTHFDASDLASVGLLKEKGSVVVGVLSNKDGAKAEPEDVPVAIFSDGGTIFCADSSWECLEFFSPSQKGFSASLTG